MPKKITIKEVFENDNWLITAIHQGRRIVRIDAKTRFRKADENNSFSEWCSEKYANQLSRENYNKNVRDFGCYKY